MADSGPYSVIHHGPLAQQISKYYELPVGETLLNIRNFSQYDLTIMLSSAVIIFLLRSALSRLIFNPIGIKHGLSGTSLHRFVENAWFSVYYSSLVVSGIAVLWKAPWLWSFDECFNEFPDDHMNEKLYGFETYYMVGLAFYTQAIFCLLFVDEKMKDFKEMLIHHICTVLLISVSKIALAHRIGSLILLLHDCVDIFLYSAKALNELKHRKSADGLFVIFAVSFFVLRLILFPYLIYVTTWNDHIRYFPQKWYLFRKVEGVNPIVQVDSYGVCLGGYCVSSWFFLVGLLCMLVVLHVYWFSIICKMIYVKLFKGREYSDPRQLGDKKRK